MDVKHPETGAVRVGVTAVTVQKQGKMKVQSVSTESLDTRLSVQKNSVWALKSQEAQRNKAVSLRTT